jgi:protein TonB
MGYLRTGAILAGALHVLMIGWAWRQRASDDSAKKEVAMTFFAAAPAPPPPPLGGGASAPKIEKVQKKPIRKDVFVQPKDPNQKPPEPEAADEPAGEPGGTPDGVPGGVIGGDPNGVIDGDPAGTGTAPPPPAPPPPAPKPPPPEGPRVFGEGMTRPTKLSGGDPVYTREALVARVEGVMIVKCVITVAGTLQGCRIIKGLPHMDKATLAALSARRYTPVMLEGRPVAVEYVFTIRLVMPD